MSHSFKKLALFLGAVLAVSSCAANEPTVVVYGLDSGSLQEPMPVHTESPDHSYESGVTYVTADDAAPVTLPETTTAAEAIPVEDAEETAANTTAAETTAPETEGTAAATSLGSRNLSMLSLSGKQSKYSFEYQKTSGAVMITGPNLVYVGESYDFGYSGSTGDTPNLLWTGSGSGGSIDRNGHFTATGKGVCTIVATDLDTGDYAALRVHCIRTDADVDFIPLVNNIPIANKTYCLPSDYDPGLNANAKAAFEKMQADAKAVGLNLFPISTYRNYTYQKQVYAGWVNMYGSDADLISARPGHSEHQLGLAIDVNSAEYSFADTREGRWLAKHCTEYGFIIRYPSHEARQYTGYSYEPWHIRYLGTDLAKAVTASGLTLEQYLGIDSYYR